MPREILQFTDLHLMADRNAVLKGVATRESLTKVLRIAKEQSRAEESAPDFVFLTGDLAHDEQLETYESLRELLGDWVPRCRVIPGNHDDRALIRKVFPEHASANTQFITFSVSTAGWRLIGLDSHVDGELHGRVGETQLQWLASELSTHAAQPTILFIHHPPVPVHSAWLDRIGLLDAAALIELVRSFSQVRAISAGHVHQEFSEVLNGIQILTTPSTGVQFLPRQQELVCDSVPPGYRIFRLDGGRFESHVVRLPPAT